MRDDDRDDRDDDRGRDRRRPRRRDRYDEDDDFDYDPRGRRRAAADAGQSNVAGLTLGIIGLVFGTVALLVSFIPCFGYYALFPGIVAVILSAVGLLLSVREKGLPIVALVVGLCSVGVAYWQGTRIDAAKEAGQKALDDVKEWQRQELERQRQNPNNRPIQP